MKPMQKTYTKPTARPAGSLVSSGFAQISMPDV